MDYIYFFLGCGLLLGFWLLHVSRVQHIKEEYDAKMMALISEAFADRDTGTYVYDKGYEDGYNDALDRANTFGLAEMEHIEEVPKDAMQKSFAFGQGS